MSGESSESTLKLKKPDHKRLAANLDKVYRNLIEREIGPDVDKLIASSGKENSLQAYQHHRQIIENLRSQPVRDMNWLYKKISNNPDYYLDNLVATREFGVLVSTPDLYVDFVTKYPQHEHSAKCQYAMVGNPKPTFTRADIERLMSKLKIQEPGVASSLPFFKPTIEKEIPPERSESSLTISNSDL